MEECSITSSSHCDTIFVGCAWNISALKGEHFFDVCELSRMACDAPNTVCQTDAVDYFDLVPGLYVLSIVLLVQR